MATKIKIDVDSNLYLDTANNAEFYNILKESNLWMDKFNTLIDKMRKYGNKIPSSFEWRTLFTPNKRFNRSVDDVKDFQKQIDNLDIEFGKWYEKTENFIYNDRYIVKRELDHSQRKLVIEHWNNILKDRQSGLSNNVQMLYTAVNALTEVISIRKSLAINYKLSSIGYVVGIFGIYLSVLFFSLSNWKSIKQGFLFIRNILLNP